MKPKIKLGEDGKRMFSVVGNPSRLGILWALWKAREELSIGRISQYSGLRKGTVRVNLPKLVESGLVLRRAYGAVVVYVLNWESAQLNALTRFFAEARL